MSLSEQSLSLAAGDSGSSHGAAAALGGADRGRGLRLTAGFQLHDQADPKPADAERCSSGGTKGVEF